MKLFSCVAVSWLIAGLLFTPGCRQEVPLPRDQALATRQVGEWLPRGTSESRARKTLVDRGFTLSRLSSDDAPDHLLIATCMRGDYMWQVGLILVDGKVTASTVTVTDLGAVSR